MASDWQTLTRLTGGRPIQIERVRLVGGDIADVVIEGRFELPPLAQLPAEDQIFVAAFVRSHGSIKQMEKFFDISYPTVKNRLNRIAQQLPLAEIAPDGAAEAGDVLSRLERGEISARDAVAALKGEHHE